MCKQSPVAHRSSLRLPWGLEERLLPAWGLSAGQRVKGAGEIACCWERRLRKHSHLSTGGSLDLAGENLISKQFPVSPKHSESSPVKYLIPHQITAPGFSHWLETTAPREEKDLATPGLGLKQTGLEVGTSLPRVGAKTGARCKSLKRNGV